MNEPKVYSKKRYKSFMYFCARKRLGYDTFQRLSEYAQQEVVKSIDEEYKEKGKIIEGEEEDDT